MEFFLTLAIITAIAGLLSATLVSGIFRSKHPYGKGIAVLVGLILFAALACGGVWLLIIESARRGHPF